MNRIRAFGAFLYDFVIGDDPMIAAVIVVALGVTALIASSGHSRLVDHPTGCDRGAGILAAPRHPIRHAAVADRRGRWHGHLPWS